MAKQTKTQSAPAPAGTAPANGTTAPKGPPVERGNDDLFKAVMKDGKFADPATKLAPQAMVIVNCVRSYGDKGVTRKALNEALVPAGLVTRQPAGRIVTYYQKTLEASGALTITRVAAPAAPVAAAPAA